jgi:hypothetical protein
MRWGPALAHTGGRLFPIPLRCPQTGGGRWGPSWQAGRLFFISFTGRGGGLPGAAVFFFLLSPIQPTIRLLGAALKPRVSTRLLPRTKKKTGGQSVGGGYAWGQRRGGETPARPRMGPARGPERRWKVLFPGPGGRDNPPGRRTGRDGGPPGGAPSRVRRGGGAGGHPGRERRYGFPWPAPRYTGDFLFLAARLRKGGKTKGVVGPRVLLMAVTF